MASQPPEWMTPPPDTHPVSGGEWHPHIVGHEVQNDGTVLVTWALPGLQRAVVRVPFSTWVDGHHQPTGRFLASFIAPLVLGSRQAPPTTDHEG